MKHLNDSRNDGKKNNFFSGVGVILLLIASIFFFSGCISKSPVSANEQTPAPINGLVVGTWNVSVRNDPLTLEFGESNFTFNGTFFGDEAASAEGKYRFIGYRYIETTYIVKGDGEYKPHIRILEVENVESNSLRLRVYEQGVEKRVTLYRVK